MAQQPDQQADAQTIAGLSAALAAGAAASVGTLVGVLAAAGITTAAAHAALSLLTAAPVDPAVALSPASTLTATSETTYRAAYLLNAARRIQAGLDAGQSLRDAIRAEAPNYRAHRQAAANRRATAHAVDVAARRYGPTLGWRAVNDDRTSAECARADGKNFSVLTRPLIGWPGSVHPHCRCRPVAPFAGAGLVDDTTAATAATQRQEAVA